MPRNRTYWNVLEAHIRNGMHDLHGMNSARGANQLRILTKLIARHAKIHKDRQQTIKYTIRKLCEIKLSGYIEVFGFDAREGLCNLTAPIWSQLGWDPIKPEEIDPTGGQNAQAQIHVPRSTD